MHGLPEDTYQVRTEGVDYATCTTKDSILKCNSCSLLTIPGLVGFPDLSHLIGVDWRFSAEAFHTETVHLSIEPGIIRYLTLTPIFGW